MLPNNDQGQNIKLAEYQQTYACNLNYQSLTYCSLNYQIRMNKLLEISKLKKTKTEKANSIGVVLDKFSPNKLKTQKSTKNITLLPKDQTYHPKPKQYCCLYHYMQGKQTKGITPCNNHVSLGVINPLTSLTRNQKLIIQKYKSKPNKYQAKENQQQIVLNADSYEVNFHTHFLNEIQNRGSKPIQLIKPRVYVETILPKHFVNKNNSFLYPKSQTKAHFKDIYNFYNLFAQKTQFITQKQVKDDLMVFARQKNIKTCNLPSQISLANVDKTTMSQYLFSKENFISYLLSHEFSPEAAQNFWQIVYNKDRFTVPERSESSLPIFKNQFISMKAFIYNYRKFYLEQEEYYRNTFSEPALRQRLIDLRLLLEPWHSRHIILKAKLRKWKKNELQTAEFLRTAGYQKDYEHMLKLIEQRNRIYFLMRTLAKSIFELTDQKNLGMDIWNDRITFLIEQKSDSLICFMEFIQRFKEHLIQQELSNPAQNGLNGFKITDMLEYLEKNKNSYEDLQQKWIIKWIRNIYKYLFHYKQHDQIYLDPITYKLCLKSPVRIEKEMITEFVHYKSIETDNVLDVLRNLTEEIDQKLESMPELQGKKKYLVECNYVAETILRIIKRNNFASFQTLFQINNIVELHGFDFQNCHQQIVESLRSSEQKSVSYSPGDKFWKQIFVPEIPSKTNQDVSVSFQTNEPYTYKDALDKYHNVKNALGIANKVNSLSMENSGKNERIREKKVKNLPKKAGEFLQKALKGKEQGKQKVQGFDWQLKYKRHYQENCSQGYCLHCEDVISTEVSSTIGRVEDMESYLMDLLKDV